MKISKHLHSCLLVEEQDKTILIDPGSYTYEEKALDVNNLAKLDYILITHEHPDHFSVPLIKELLTKFPQTKIFTNPSIVSQLQKENLIATTDGDEQITLEPLPHESLWDLAVPPNVLFRVFNKLTHPGDSHHFDKTTDVLALPVQAPWGSTKPAVELALQLQPKVIIPIHDWMWKDGYRQTMYKRLEGFFKEKNIDFKSLETGEVVEAYTRLQ